MESKKGITRILFAASVIILAAVCGIVTGIAAYRARRQTPVYEFSESDSIGALADKGTNILLLGTDRQASLCDVMMLVNVAFDEERITVAHIPRDTYARYTEKSYKKLNGAYNTLGGAEEVAQLLSDIFDITIDHYACIGLDTLGDIVDAVGGVEVNIPQSMRYYDPDADLYIDLKAGKTLLNGDKAEQFLRYRSGYADGDLGRIEAQKLFVASLFSKLADEMDPIMAAKLCSAADGIETDLSIPEWLQFGLKALSLTGTDVNVVTLPGEHLTAHKSGASYYCLSAPSNAEIMKNYFGGDGNFDRNKQLLNPDYEDFGQAYSTKKDYSLSSIEKIVKDNIKN